MNSTEALREFAEKWMPMVRYKDKERFIEVLTAVISEHYVERAKYDEAVDDYMRLLDRYDAMIDNDDDDDIDTDDDLN